MDTHVGHYMELQGLVARPGKIYLEAQDSGSQAVTVLTTRLQPGQLYLSGL